MAVTQQMWNVAVQESIRRIKADSCYSGVLNVANAVSKGAFYLAGGKLYRTIAEVLYGGDFGSKKADWDFVSLDTDDNPSTFVPFWVATRGPGITQTSPSFNYKGSTAKIGQNLQLNRSWRFENTQLGYNLSVDIVAIEDIKAGGNIDDYLYSVPLSIQSIAMQIHSPIMAAYNNVFFGPNGIDALKNKIIHWNNKNKLRPIPSQSPDLYFDSKLASMPGFLDGRAPTQNSVPSPNTVGVSKPKYPRLTNPNYIHYEPKVAIKKDCSCSSSDLFAKGCRCGAVVPYKGGIC